VKDDSSRVQTGDGRVVEEKDTVFKNELQLTWIGSQLYKEYKSILEQASKAELDPVERIAAAYLLAEIQHEESETYCHDMEMTEKTPFDICIEEQFKLFGIDKRMAPVFQIGYVWSHDLYAWSKDVLSTD
jgi:hypothetical protein